MTTPRGKARNRANIASSAPKHGNQRQEELNVMHRTRKRNASGTEAAGDVTRGGLSSPVPARATRNTTLA